MPSLDSVPHLNRRDEKPRTRALTEIRGPCDSVVGRRLLATVSVDDLFTRRALDLGLMFESSDPAVFTWCVTTCGPDANLFVDHSQVIQLEALCRGLSGTAVARGRVVTFKPEESAGGHRRTRTDAASKDCSLT